MKRLEAIQVLLGNLAEPDLALFTTGMISREAHALGDRPGSFYMIGSMGLLSAVGLGIARHRPRRRVVVVEGDGSALMSLGTLPLIASEAPQNFHHVVLDNEAYESTGNQPTISASVDLSAIARAAGYGTVARCTDLASFQSSLRQHLATTGPTFLLAKVTGRAPHDISRIELTPIALRDRFHNAVLREGPTP